MEVRAVVEYNSGGYLIYAENYIGAFVRGKTKNEALAKFHDEILQYLWWLGENAKITVSTIHTTIVQEKESTLQICDADTEVIFSSEKKPLTQMHYESLKKLTIKSASDFQLLYDSIPNKADTVLAPRKTFYDTIPRTAHEMYEHTKCVNSYYFGEIELVVNAEPDIISCRELGFAKLEMRENFLQNIVYDGKFDEQWSVHKVCRRFIWHDRIHAKAMYRMATKLCGTENIANPFYFLL